MRVVRYVADVVGGGVLGAWVVPVGLVVLVDTVGTAASLGWVVWAVMFCRRVAWRGRVCGRYCGSDGREMRAVAR